jgi:hypothetical protein
MLPLLFTATLDIRFHFNATYGWTVQLNRMKTYIPVKTISTFSSSSSLTTLTANEPVLTRDTEHVSSLTLKDILEKEDDGGSVLLTIDEMSAEHDGRLLFMTLKYKDSQRPNMHHTLVVELHDEACVVSRNALP